MKNSRITKITAKELVFEGTVMQMEFLSCSWIPGGAEKSSQKPESSSTSLSSGR